MKVFSYRILLLVVGVVVLSVSVCTMYGRLSGSSKLEKAMSLYEAGDEKRAYDLFNDIYSKQPHSRLGTEALYYLCRMGRGSPGERIACWKKFLDRDPSGEMGVVGKLELAGLYEKMGENEKAMETYRGIIEGAPRHSRVVRAMYRVASISGETGKLEEARDMLRLILEEHPDIPEVADVQKDLGDVNMAMLLGRKIHEPLSVEYEVKSGDSLEKIARKFNTTVELLKRCNDKEDAAIRVNERLKVVQADISTLIDKSQCTLSLFINGELFNIYSVGTGKDNVTPVGRFKIVNKGVEPVWYRPGGGEIPYGDPENLLGTRWMGIDSPGYGIHGTWEPETVGKQSSAGCIRLLNEDVEELFMILPPGTPVTIVD